MIYGLPVYVPLSLHLPIIDFYLALCYRVLIEFTVEGAIHTSSSLRKEF